MLKHWHLVNWFAVLNLLLWGANSVFAEGVTAYDYYSGDYKKQLLKDVESHHIGPGIERMNGKEHMWIYAMGDFDFILAHFPNHPQGLSLKAQVARKLGKPHLAEKSFQKALELYPNTASTYLVYGTFLHQSGKTELAVANYKKALVLNPYLKEAHYNLGLAYFVEKRYDQANKEANDAYDLGHPLPGLRRKLEQVGAWKLLPKLPEEEKQNKTKTDDKLKVETKSETKADAPEPSPAQSHPLKLNNHQLKPVVLTLIMENKVVPLRSGGR